MSHGGRRDQRDGRLAKRLYASRVDGEPRDVAVDDLACAVSTRRAERDPERAAVRHDEHAAVGMRLRDALERGEDAARELLARLAVAPRAGAAACG